MYSDVLGFFNSNIDFELLSFICYELYGNGVPIRNYPFFKSLIQNQSELNTLLIELIIDCSVDGESSYVHHFLIDDEDYLMELKFKKNF